MGGIAGSETNIEGMTKLLPYARLWGRLRGDVLVYRALQR